MIRRGGARAADRSVATDVAIIGSGPGGGVAAARLAAAGLKVALLEEGPAVGAADFNQRERDMVPLLYQERGLRHTRDLAFSILQGRAVGGGSNVNWTTCFEPPPAVLSEWAQRSGLPELESQHWTVALSRVARRIEIQPVGDEEHNANNLALLRGARRLGWRCGNLRRNVTGCVRSGFCGLGCSYNAKRSIPLTYLRDALERGAELFAEARVDRVLLEGVRAVGVEARTAAGGRLAVRAPIVVVSGGAINTPGLLLRSGLGAAQPRIGRGTYLHPTTAVIGLYDRVIDAGYGIPQSAFCDQFADLSGGYGYRIETAPAYPGIAAAALPSFGAQHRQLAELSPHIAITIALVRDGAGGEPDARVLLEPDGTPLLDYRLGAADRTHLLHGMQRMAELHFAAGARRVLTLHSDPLLLERAEQIGWIAERGVVENELALFSAHPQGGCGVGRDPRRSVCDGAGAVHGVRGLFVCDGSLFPASVGVNPQVTIMALAERISEQIVRRAPRLLT
ncbi:MAG TPA: GMC family oxidoreductase [Acidobacteriota bacterium]